MASFAGLVEDTKVEAAPRSKESIAGGDWLKNFLSSFGPVDMPTQGVAGLSSLQQQLLGYLQQGQAGSRQRLGLSGDEITKTLTDSYDPRVGDYYKGLKQEADQTRSRGKTRIRQIANQGGMLSSSPTAEQEADFGSEVDSQLLDKLRGLYEVEREKKLDVARATPGLESSKTDVTGQAIELADVERQVEQERNNALYTTALQSLLFQYQQQAQVALGMLGNNPGSAVTGGGLTNLGVGFSLGAEAIKTYFQAKYGGGKR